MIEIVPATLELARAYYGAEPPFTFMGWVAVKNGRPLGLAGLYREGGLLNAFCDFSDEMRQHKGHMLEGTKRVARMLRATTRPVFAKCNPLEPAAPALLKRLGFVPLADNLLVRMPA